MRYKLCGPGAGPDYDESQQFEPLLTILLIIFNNEHLRSKHPL